VDRETDAGIFLEKNRTRGCKKAMGVWNIEAQKAEHRGPKARGRGEVLRRGSEGSERLPHQLRGLGSAMSSPSRVWGGAGGAPADRWFAYILNTSDGLWYSLICNISMINSSHNWVS